MARLDCRDRTETKSEERSQIECRRRWVPQQRCSNHLEIATQRVLKAWREAPGFEDFRQGPEKGLRCAVLG